MTISVDANGPPSAQVAGATSVSVNHTTGGSATGIGWMWSGYTVGGGAVTATYNGSATGVIKEKEDLDGVTGRTPTGFSLLAPASGSQAVACANASGMYGALGVLSVNGGSPSDCCDNIPAAVRGTGDPCAITTTSSANEIGMSNFITGASIGATFTINGTETQILNSSNTTLNTCSGSTYKQGTNVAFSETGFPGVAYAAIAMCFVDGGAAPPSTVTPNGIIYGGGYTRGGSYNRSIG